MWFRAAPPTLLLLTSKRDHREVPLKHLRRTLIACTAALAGLGAVASPSNAIVGGTNAPAGKYTSIAEITFGFSFLCTGRLIAPDTVLTAGHCGSITGAAVASPAGWPPQLIDVKIGGHTDTEGEDVPVQKVTVEPNYLLNSGYD